MSWASKPSYPPDATRTVSMKATEDQKNRWSVAATRRGLATPGAFVAFAADIYLAVERAYLDANHEHHVSINPVSAAEEAQREEEWAQERWRQRGGR
jgi:hypothetical protein